MTYKLHQIYHLYNQGNNQQPIFFKEENYLYFLRKMRKHLLPLVDILCYCLMPNHFHWLVCTKEEACLHIPRKKYRPELLDGNSTLHSNYSYADNQQALSKAIGVLVGGYAKGINKQENRTGSLFRGKTKAKDGIIDGLITINGKNRNLFFQSGNNYAFTCFNYIHENPIEVDLVKRPEDWLYSSARDYAGLRNGTMCNQKLAKKLLNL